MKKVLLFFSGGNDSTLSACKLASAGYDVYLITFDNGCEEGLENIKNRATILEKLFNYTSFGKIHNLGVFPSAPEFMALRYHSNNMPLSSIINKYGDLNQNQINCLNCRSSMYVVGAVVAKEMGINNIADGARKTQMFALEQEELLNGYKTFLNKYGITLLLPVFEYATDNDVKQELWDYSNDFYNLVHNGTIHYEAKCWLGVPMDKELSKEEILGYSKFFEDVLEPNMERDVDKYPTYPIKELLKKPVYTKIRYR